MLSIIAVLLITGAVLALWLNNEQPSWLIVFVLTLLMLLNQADAYLWEYRYDQLAAEQD